MLRPFAWLHTPIIVHAVSIMNDNQTVTDSSDHE